MSILGNISFPGVTAPQHLLATRTNGCRPDVAILFAQPQATLSSAIGTLSFGFNATTINWTNALCDSFTQRFTTQGQQQIFRILDCRWKWSKHYITGGYNVRLPGGTVDATTQKTLVELATLLFTAAGVASYDLTQITSTEKPMVIWDQTNVADALEELLEQRGYVVSLNVDDTVKVWQVGNGASISPGTDAVNISVSVNPPEPPANLKAACAQTRVQSKLKMVPLALDTDGTIKLIGGGGDPTKDVSYNPTLGDPNGMDGLDLVTFSWLTDPVAQDCAKASVGLWFGIGGQADGSDTISDGTTIYAAPSGAEVTITSKTQYLPLSRFLLGTGTNAYGIKAQQDAYIEGTFIDTSQQPPPKNTGGGRNTPDFTRLSRLDWDLDERLGIVKFGQPAVKWNAGTSKQTFADVYLTCSYSVGNPQVKDRYLRSKAITGGYGEEVVPLIELQRTLICSYTPPSTAITSINDNKTTVVQPAADLYLNQAVLKYTTAVGVLILARNIYAYNCDGITLQLMWQCAEPNNPTPFNTLISQQAEVNPLLPTRAQRATLRRNRLTPDAGSVAKDRFRTTQKTNDVGV